MTSVLAVLAGALRDEDTVISDHVTEPAATPFLGPFVALGPRCQGAPDSYALVIESIREGYLLHYGTSRVLTGLDADLALLAGDHLYALGLERLAALGDVEAVRELADVISLSAVLGGTPGLANSVWIAGATAIAAGGTDDHEAAKAALRSGDASAGPALTSAAHRIAEKVGLEVALGDLSEAIEFAPETSVSGGG